MTLAQARSRIRKAHCSVGHIRSTRSTRVGRVIGQSPKPGKSAKRGSKVNLTVGRR